MLGQQHVLPSVMSSLKEVLVEGTVPQGTFLVAVEKPICSTEGNISNALYGSFLPVPSQDIFPELEACYYQPENLRGAIIPFIDIGLFCALQTQKIGQ